MSGIPAKTFNLPWHQHEFYTIIVFSQEGFTPPLRQALSECGMHLSGDGAMILRTATDWKTAWDTISIALKRTVLHEHIEVALVPGDMHPDTADRRSLAHLDLISQNLWLGQALLEDRLLCYLQPVVSSKDKIFGYESFARVKAKDGSIIGGDKIVAASRALGIEYMIDRHLHIQAIKTFISSDFNGFLFINFFPGFIHRPAVYLEGLGETARNYGIIAKHLVLDFTRAEASHDLAHLKSVCDYARSRGYSIALDDIESVEGARKLIPEIHPDFVKIDMHLVRQVEDERKRDTIREIVSLVHAAGSTVIAEGVETEEMHTRLKQLDVDLFQGYHFSPPVPVEAVLKRSTGTGS